MTEENWSQPWRSGHDPDDVVTTWAKWSIVLGDLAQKWSIVPGDLHPGARAGRTDADIQVVAAARLDVLDADLAQ